MVLGGFHGRPHRVQFLFRFKGGSDSQGVRVLANKVGSGLQYLGQRPGPCAQKELVGQASLRVLVRSLGLANPGIQEDADLGANLYPVGLAVLLGW